MAAFEELKGRKFRYLQSDGKYSDWEDICEGVTYFHSSIETLGGSFRIKDICVIGERNKHRYEIDRCLFESKENSR